MWGEIFTAETATTQTQANFQPEMEASITGGRGGNSAAAYNLSLAFSLYLS
jgi:hypothetical protein